MGGKSKESRAVIGELCFSCTTYFPPLSVFFFFLLTCPLFDILDIYCAYIVYRIKILYFVDPFCGGRWPSRAPIGIIYILYL